MNDDKKLAFIANMTGHALRHIAVAPNVPSPKGVMSHDKMLSFVAAMAKHGLQNFDTGGTALQGPVAAGPAQNTATGGFNGAIGSFLGTNDKFQASGTPIQAGTNTGQLDRSYGAAQGALGTQGNIANTLNVGLTRGASTQDTLTGMYLNQARGQGPNPALDELHQQTGQNIAQTAALMASQRGAGANPGLVARQAAMQGAATQQQAVGQEATNEAQQQLAAENNLQNLSANEIAQGTQSTQAFNSATQNEQNILQGANTANNNANVAMQSDINNVNAQIATGNQKNGNNILGGIGGVLSNVPVIGGLFGAEGGDVTSHGFIKDEMPWGRAIKMAQGGSIQGQATSGPQSYVGQWLNSSVDAQGPNVQPMAQLNTDIESPFKRKSKETTRAAQPGAQAMGAGDDSVPMIAPMDMAGGYDSNMPSASLAYRGGLMNDGGGVKAQAKNQKAVKPGDSLANDKIPAVLSEGEIVIPRHITMGPNAPAKAAMFVAKELAERGRR